MLFGTTGASLVVKDIKASDVGNSLIIIFVGGAVRLSSMFLITIKQNLNFKEKLLMAISWASKGSISAIFGGIVLMEAKAKGEDYSEYATLGNKMQTCSVLAILICTPVSSMLTMSLGPVLLTKD